MSKPSLRKRLFSTSAHILENSASTSSTLADPQANDGQDPVTLAVAVSPDREQSSVNATLSSRRVPFYRRITSSKASTLSDPSLVKSSSSTPCRSSSSRSRPSLFSRVVHRVVPCVSADPDLLKNDSNLDIHLPTSEPTTCSTSEVQMQQLAPDPLSSPLPPSTPSSSTHSQPSPLTLPLTVTSVPGHPPPSPTDSEIIVPPPPSAQLLPDEVTDGVTSGAVQPPGSTGHTPTHSHHVHVPTDLAYETDDEPAPVAAVEVQEEDNESVLIKKGGSGIPIGPDGQPQPLLPPILPEHAGRKCLVLDLDETLVHSSFKAVQQADFIVPVEIEYHWHHFHVLKRPGVDDFLKRMGEIYEVVVFTASLSKYADPVLDKLDPAHTVTHRLFRESCFAHKGNYVKDLSQLGRPIGDLIILDNSPASYIFHPRNAVPVSSWFNDPHDAELTDLIPFLVDLTVVGDVRGILDGSR